MGRLEKLIAIDIEPDSGFREFVSVIHKSGRVGEHVLREYVAWDIEIVLLDVVVDANPAYAVGSLSRSGVFVLQRARLEA
jgi:hypothetical protein